MMLKIYIQLCKCTMSQDIVQNYSETTGILWFYSNDETIDFNADIANNNNFKSFKYKARFLGKTAEGGSNGTLKKMLQLLYHYNI